MILLVLVLAACSPMGDTAPTRSPAPSLGEGEPDVLLTCFYADGSQAGTFTRLEEAWASTNYVRIDWCEGQASGSRELELTEVQAEAARAAQAGLPDEDLVTLYLRTLAACVRIAPDGEHGMATQPTSILEATLLLCPEAPHSGLIQAELQARSDG
jgi:hypothetical protein